MGKTLLLSDSACDISIEREFDTDHLKILNLLLGVNGRSMFERADITAQEYYKLLWESEELPTHAVPGISAFHDAFSEAVQGGYTDIIYLAINGKGSSTFSVAVNAKQLFEEEYPELYNRINIYIIDSRSYSLGYGLPLLMAAELVAGGKTAEEIVNFLTDYLHHRAIYVGLGTLKFAKRSGRLGATSAFAGELLGIRPIIGFPDGENKVFYKVRGEKAVVQKLFELYKNEVSSPNDDYAILYGEDVAPALELRTLIESYSGKKPLVFANVGPCVATNSGPQIVGIVFRSREKGEYTAEVM